MLYSRKRTLEDRVTELLVSAPYQIGALHEQLLHEDSDLSLRAVYKAVHNLVLAGVLLKAGKIVRIDGEWVRSTRSRLLPGAPQRLAPGERMTYSFRSLSHLDAFWKTIVLQIEEYEKDGQVFLYNPHNFWAYMSERKESENAYYAHFAGSKLHAFFTVGGSSAADKEFKRAYQDDYMQIHAERIPSFSRVHHLTVLGDHIVSVRIGKTAAERIDALYATEKSIAELLPSLRDALKGSVPSRFVLEHNPLKAEKLRKALSRNFYFLRSHSTDI